MCFVWTLSSRPGYKIWITKFKFDFSMWRIASPTVVQGHNRFSEVWALPSNILETLYNGDRVTTINVLWKDKSASLCGREHVEGSRRHFSSIYVSKHNGLTVHEKAGLLMLWGWHSVGFCELDSEASGTILFTEADDLLELQIYDLK